MSKVVICKLLGWIWYEIVVKDFWKGCLLVQSRTWKVCVGRLLDHWLSYKTITMLWWFGNFPHFGSQLLYSLDKSCIISLKAIRFSAMRDTLSAFFWLKRFQLYPLFEETPEANWNIKGYLHTKTGQTP